MDKYIKAQWTINSENGYFYLIDLKTNEVLAIKDRDGNWEQPEDK